VSHLAYRLDHLSNEVALGDVLMGFVENNKFVELLPGVFTGCENPEHYDKQTKRLVSRIFPPVEFCRGTKPSQAANSRPERNTFGSATVVAMAVAMIGPMPGMLASR
jgi:hypothetical protein